MHLNLPFIAPARPFLCQWCGRYRRQLDLFPSLVRTFNIASFSAVFSFTDRDRLGTGWYGSHVTGPTNLGVRVGEWGSGQRFWRNRSGFV